MEWSKGFPELKSSIRNSCFAEFWRCYQISIYVIGGSSYLGRYLYRETKGSDSSFAKAIWTHNEHPLGYTRYLNLLDDSRKEVLQALGEQDLVLFLSGISEPSEVFGNASRAYETNVKGTQSLLCEIAKKGASLIYLSSVEVFDGSAAPNNENTKMNPLNIYGRMKMSNEQKILSLFAPGKHCIVRTPWIVNPLLGSRCVIAQTLKGLEAGNMKFATDYLISLVSANLVLRNLEALVRNFHSNLPETLHFVSEGFTSRHALAERVNSLRAKPQNQVLAVQFHELLLEEPRSSDTRMSTLYTWASPFSNPDDIYSIVDEKMAILQKGRNDKI